MTARPGPTRSTPATTSCPRSPTNAANYDTTLACFNDNGAGTGGVANDGIQNGTEPAVSVGASDSVAVAQGADVVCTYTNTRHASVRYTKVTDPASDPQDFVFGVTGTGMVGDTLDTDPASADPNTHVETLDSSEFGPKTISETLPAGWDLTSIVCNGDADSVVTASGASLDVDAGETIVCTFTNTKRGKVEVVKTVSGLVPPAGTTFDFEIRTGVTNSAVGTTVDSCTTDATGECDFGGTTFVPGNYFFCETNMLPGWTSSLSSQAGAIVPNNTDPNHDNGVICVPFTLAAGETEVFTVDNTPPPGGDARTIGFWKNHTSCDGRGNQDPVLDDTLTIAGQLVIGILVVTAGDPNACEILVDLLDKRDYKSASALKDGKKLASDPTFNFASQYIAYLLNIAAGAGTCAAADTAAAAGQQILLDNNFDGSSGDGTTKIHDSISKSEATLLNGYAGIVDDYNNNTLCP